MKRFLPTIIAILIALNVFLPQQTIAQAPEKMSYQAVIRNSSNQLVTNQAVGMRISILQGSNTGTAVYTETQTPTTNTNGLVSIEIGGGAGFSSIDWSTGTYFIKTETDPDGGTSYNITGTSQLLSVPYALFAKTSDYNNLSNKPVFAAVATSGNYNDLSNKPTTNGSETKVMAGTNVSITGTGTSASPYVINALSGGVTNHYVGELYGGGIVVYLWKEAGEEKGLIASLTDLSTSIPWSNITEVGVWDASSYINGQANTIAIIGQDGHTSSAAKICDDYINPETGTGEFSDWYLPALWELDRIHEVKFIINSILGDAGGLSYSYWSSTEYSSNSAEGRVFRDGSGGRSMKYYPISSVRAVRRF